MMPTTSGPRCARCVTDYRAANWDPLDLQPSQRYPDPHCEEATPWCPLYQQILKRIAENNPAIASLMAGIRATMKRRLERKAG